MTQFQDVIYIKGTLMSRRGKVIPNELQGEKGQKDSLRWTTMSAKNIPTKNKLLDLSLKPLENSRRPLATPTASCARQDLEASDDHNLGRF